MNYLNIYNKLIEKAKLTNKNLTKNFERHHIKPRSLFPELIKDKSNIVKLTYKQHYVAHHLLFKYYKSINDKNAMIKMGFAFFRLCKNTDGLHVNAHQYEVAKKINNEINILRTTKLWQDENYRNKMTAIQQSDEYRKKQSLAKKGKPGKNKGKKFGHLSEEHKKLISEKLTGITRSEETKKKMSESTKKQFSDPILKEKHRLAVLAGVNKKEVKEHKKEIIKKFYKKIYCIELDKEFESIHDAAKQLNLYPSCICFVLKGKYKSTGGFTFKYVD